MIFAFDSENRNILKYMKIQKNSCQTAKNPEIQGQFNIRKCIYEFTTSRDKVGKIQMMCSTDP